MNTRRVVFVVALALILGGGVLYKSPISFAAGNTASAYSETRSNFFYTQAASVYTAVQDFWNGIFGTPDLAKSPTGFAPEAPASNLEAQPPKVPTSPPSLGNPTSKLPPTTRTVVTQPVIERTIEHTTERVLSGVTSTDLESQISALRTELLTEISKGKSQAVSDNNALYLAMAPMNRINNLSSVTLSNPTITGATVSSGSLSGTFSGSVTGSTGSFDTLGIGTTTPSAAFAVNGVTYLADVATPAVTANRLYSTSGNLYWAGSIIGGSVGSWTPSGSDVYRATGNVGIGTTSPFTTLSVTGNAYLSGALNVGATSTTRINLGLDYATSTDITNRTSIATWGDSLTGDNVSILTNTNRYPLVLASLTGYTVYNGGVSGETSTSIKNRMLAATDKYSYPTIIWAGRNNYSSPTTVKADIAAMVAALTTDRYIILGVVNSDTASEWSGGGNYTIITQLNTDLAAIYGSHFIDIRAYLISNGLNDAGITATAQDLIDIGHDVPPSSLRVDTLHYNSAGYASVAKRINQSISLLQRTTATALTPESLLTVNLKGFKTAGVTVLSASTTNYATLTGLWAGAALNGSGLYNTATGYLALSTATSSSYNTAFGYGSLQNTLAGSRNTAVGYFSGQLNTYGTDNTATGYYAGYGNSTGTDNTAIGGNALQTNSTGSQNTATGRYALYQSSSANGNTANGYTALFNNTGSQNTAVGLGALYANGAAGDNTSIGYQSLYANTTGSQNTALGFRAGWGDGTVNMRSSVDTYGTFLGYEASRDPSIPTATVLTNITAIGKNARVATSNSIVLGGTGADAVNVGIGTTSPYAALSVVGQVVGSYFTATSTTATSTFANNISIGSGSTYRINGVPLLGANSSGAFIGGDQSGNARGQNSVDIVGLRPGATAVASGNFATAIGGYNLTASGAGSVAIGYSSVASNTFSVALGDANTASGVDSTAIGYNNTASGYQSTAVGSSNGVTAGGASAFGSGLTNNIASSTMIGPNQSSAVVIRGDTGYVGVGVVNPTSLLHVASSTHNIQGDTLTNIGFFNDTAVGISNGTGVDQGSHGVDFRTTLSGIYNMGSMSSAYGIVTNNATAGTVTHLMGIVGRSYNASSGNVTDNTGFYGDFTNSGSGITANGSAFLAQSPVISAGTVTNAYGLRVNNIAPSGSGTVVNGYGVGITLPTGATGNNIGLLIGAAPASQTSSLYVSSGTSYFGGNIGIGTTTPYSILSISNSAVTAVNTPLFTVASTTAGTATSTLMTILASGNVGIGTAAPAKALQVIGDIRVGTSGTNGCVENFAGTALTGVCSSDVSLKTNIQPLGSVLPGLVQLTPSTFYWNDIAGNELHNSTTTLNYGLIAQDVARVLPNMVATTSNGYLGVNYSMLPILTLQGLKELDLKVEDLASTTAATVDMAGNKTFAGRFFDRITGWLADAANGIGEVVARVFRGKVFHAEEKICIGQPGNETCITKDQLDALLLGKSASDSTSTTVNTATTTTPIVISINGNNPATINIGDTYGDLGALITAPESAKNFGIKASLDGGPSLDISQISLNTSAAGTHKVTYFVVDQNNATTTAERIVNVVAPAPAEMVATTSETVAVDAAQ